MKNKGFTLVEIISALIILAILLVVAIPGVNGIQKSLKNNMYCNKIGSIEAAAKLYGQDFVDEIEQTGYKNVSIKTLIDNNLIEKEDNDCVSGSEDKPCLADPRDNSSLDSNNVRIFKKGDKVTAYYVYETSEDIDMCGGKDEEEMKGQEETIRLENGTNLTKQGQESISVKFGDKFPDITQLPEKNYRVKLIDNFDGTEKVIKEETIKHTLKGYYLTQNDNSSQYYNGNGTSSLIFKDAHVNTLYAHWNYTSYRLPNLDGPNARTGYIVEGWYIKGTQIKVGSVGSNYIPTKDNIVLVAKWIPQRKTITLDDTLPDGTDPQIIAEYDADLPTIDIPKRTYTVTFNGNGGNVSPTSLSSTYVFHGYYSEKNGQGTQYIKADGTSARKWDSTTIQTLYAYWTKPSITLPNASRTGYTFVDSKWFTSPTGTVTMGKAGQTYTPTKNETLYAHWTANKYTVTLNNQSATGSGTTSITATYDSNMPNISIPSRTYTISYNANGGSVSPTSVTTSYKFSGYYTGTNGGGTKYINDNGTSARTWNIASNTTLYAYWTQGSVSLPTPSRTGYTFAGWYTAASGGSKVGNAGGSYAPTSNITLYAHWTANNYVVTLNNQGATGAGTTSITATYDSNLPNISAPSKSFIVYYNANGGSVSPSSEYATSSFSGYYTGTNGTGTKYINSNGTSARTWNIASNTTLYAHWTGGRINLPTPSRTGYTFAGWYTAASGGSKVGNAGSSYAPTSNVTLYAHWTANNYTVYLSAPGANPSSQTITATFDQNLPTVTVPTRNYTVYYNGNGGSVSESSRPSNLTFHGFYTGSNGTGTQYITASGTSARTWNIASNVTLYAHMTGGGVILPNASRSGYELNGWYTASSGGYKVGNAGQAYTPSSDITLYAQWTQKTFTITFDQQGGSGGTTSVSATYGQSLPSASAPSRADYSFEGYYTGTGGTGTQYYNSSMTPVRTMDQANNITLYAKWTGIPYTLYHIGHHHTGSEGSRPNGCYTFRTRQRITCPGVGVGDYDAPDHTDMGSVKCRYCGSWFNSDDAWVPYHTTMDTVYTLNCGYYEGQELYTTRTLPARLGANEKLIRTETVTPQ